MVLRLVRAVLLLHSLQVVNLRSDHGEVTVAHPKVEEDSEGRDGRAQDYAQTDSGVDVGQVE